MNASKGPRCKPVPPAEALQPLIRAIGWAVIRATALVVQPAMAWSQQDVRAIKNIGYIEQPANATRQESSRQQLDLYLPTNKHCFPTVMSIHGGELLRGDKSNDEAISRLFASNGIAAASINYRLTPEVSHPSHLQDATAAFAWVKRHIARYGGDPNTVFVMGHSAGAYLAAKMALDPIFLAQHSLKPDSIRGLLAVSGFVDVEAVAPRRPLAIWGKDPTLWRHASAKPLPWSKTTNPTQPWLLIITERDAPWRRDQNYQFISDLHKAGFQSISLIDVKGHDHHSIWEGISANHEVSTLLINFIRNQLHNTPSDQGSCSTANPADAAPLRRS